MFSLTLNNSTQARKKKVNLVNILECICTKPSIDGASDPTTNPQLLGSSQKISS